MSRLIFMRQRRNYPLLQPVVDRVFQPAEIGQAMACLRSGEHIGKVCLVI